MSADTDMSYTQILTTRLMQTLTTRQVLPVRLMVGSLASLGTLAFTLKPALMRETWRRSLHDHDLKLAVRRVAWYGNKSPLRLQVMADPAFDFTEGLTRSELAALRSFIEARKQSASDHLLDQLLLTAAEVTDSMSPSTWQDLLQRYASHANVLLELLSRHRAPLRGEVYPPKRGRVFSRSMARQALADFAALFPQREIPWYVVSGTFLGLVRENGFLAHDYDIDLGINVEDLDSKLLLGRLEHCEDFHIRKRVTQSLLEPRSDGGCSLVSRPVLLKLEHRNGIALDLFFHYQEGDVRYHGSSVHLWHNRAFTLEEYELEGIPVLGPGDADRYLTENYGDWRTPVTSFNCSTSTPNVRIVRNLTSISLFMRRLAFCRLNGDISGDRIEALLRESGYLDAGTTVPRFITDTLVTTGK